MKELGKILVSYGLLGLVVGTGIRTAEWFIPAPEMRVIVCTYGELDKLECKPAADLLRKK